MKRRFLKICATIGLSLVITYGGVAWAFDDCLKDAGKTAQTQSLDRSPASEFPLWNIEWFPCGSSPTKLHCLSAYYEFDAMAQAPSTTSSGLDYKVSQLKKSFLAGELSSLADIETARRSPHLDCFVPFSPLGSLPRYLVLAVFII